MFAEVMKQGTKVYDIRFGWGVVKEVTDGIYPVKVWFKTGEPVQYTIDGKDYIGQDVSLLKEYEYEIVTKEQIYKAYYDGLMSKENKIPLTNTEEEEIELRGSAYYKHRFKL